MEVLVRTLSLLVSESTRAQSFHPAQLALPPSRADFCSTIPRYILHAHALMQSLWARLGCKACFALPWGFGMLRIFVLCLQPWGFGVVKIPASGQAETANASASKTQGSSEHHHRHHRQKWGTLWSQAFWAGYRTLQIRSRYNCNSKSRTLTVHRYRHYGRDWLQMFLRKVTCKSLLQNRKNS